MQREKLKKRKADDKRHRRQERKSGNATMTPETDRVANEGRRDGEVAFGNGREMTSNDEICDTIRD
jgi:hypothetical protein